ncbi:MAG: hAT transposon family protein [Planctomycetota bacterium]
MGGGEKSTFIAGAFWGEYCDRLPIHCAIWRGQSTSLVTSANVESCFSLSGRIMAPNRSRLGVDVMPSMMFIAANWSKLDVKADKVWSDYVAHRANKKKRTAVAIGSDTEDEIFAEGFDGDDDCGDLEMDGRPAGEL